MSECKIHSWSSSNPNKPCPTCFFNEVEITRLKARNEKLERVMEAVYEYIKLGDEINDRIDNEDDYDPEDGDDRKISGKYTDVRDALKDCEVGDD